MALFTGAIDKLKSVFSTKVHVEPVAIVLTKADGSADIQGSGGNGDALVSLSSASTAALASQATLASVLAQLVSLLAALGEPTIPTAITPTTGANITAVATKGFYIGGSGNLVVKGTGSDTAATFVVQPGQYVKGAYKECLSTTTATGIVALS